VDFGKLQSVDDVDFALPADAPHNAARLAASGPAREPGFRIGTPRFADPGYRGKLVPKGAEMLPHYAKHFATVELNSTYYALDGDQCARWGDAVAGLDFRFCPKLPAELSHAGRMTPRPGQLERILQQFQRFGESLGTCWVLPPPDFTSRDQPILERFLDAWGARWPLAVELRHESWFKGGAVEVFELLAQHGATAVITDTAGRRDVIHQQLTSKRVFLRFVGNRLHATDFARLDAWAKRLGAWFDQGVEQFDLFMHQPEEHLCTEAAMHFVDALAAQGIEDLRRPQPIPVETQGSLF
jgi:uncharacterized protein YecE (DUF72 family)